MIAGPAPTPSGKQRWNQATIRGILSNPLYSGEVYAGRTHPKPARVRRSALTPIGRPTHSRLSAPPEEWILVATVPPIVSQEQFDLVQAKLAHNQQFAKRNNHAHDYLLCALVSCGLCRAACMGRMAHPGYPYYLCRGKLHPSLSCHDQKCLSRFIPAQQLDELVWQDVCEVLTHPHSIAQALQRAQGGHWLPQELQARREQLRKGRLSLEQQLERLTQAYLGQVIPLAEYQRRRQELEQKLQALGQQTQQLEAGAERQLELAGLLTLNAGEGYLKSAVLDTANGFGYFGTYTAPAIIVKVRLSDFTRVGALTLNTGENFLHSAVIDTASGIAYFAAATLPGIVVKVRLSDFTRVSALTLNTGENAILSSVIDTTNGFAYFGTNTSPGIVVKVRLSDFSRVSALTLNTGEAYLYSAVIDTANGFAYFGAAIFPGIVVKIQLSDFTRLGALTLNAGEDQVGSAVIDTANGFGYFGTLTAPGIVVKVKLSDLTRVGALTLNIGEEDLDPSVIDTANGFAYFGTVNSPGIVVKVKLSDLTRVSAVTLNQGEDQLRCAAIDTANGFAYFGTFTGPGVVVRMNLNAPDLVPQLFLPLIRR